MRYKPWILVTIATISIIFSVVFITGCVTNGTNNASNDSKTVITLTDLADRTVTIQGPIKSIVMADPDAFNAYAAVAGPTFLNKLVGITSALKANNPDIYSAYEKKYPEISNISEVGDVEQSTFSTEKVIQLKPDVLILPLWSQTMNLAPDIGVLEKAGINVVFVDFYLNQYDGVSYEKSIAILGKLLGNEDRAEQINSFYDAQIKAVNDTLEKINKPMPNVYIEFPGNGPDQFGFTMAHLGMSLPIDFARAHNIAIGSCESWGTISPEYFFKSDPDVVVFCMVPGLLPDSGGSAFGFGAHPSDADKKKIVADYLNRTGWSSVKAVKNGNVDFYYSGLGYSLDNYVVLQYMAKWFYPTEFANLDPEKNMQTFYSRFMPIPLDGTWYFSSGEVSGTR